MKKFAIENWYKFMIGSSMLMASFGFMVYAIGPARAAAYEQTHAPQNAGVPVATNGVLIGEYAYFVDGGTVYRWDSSRTWNSLTSWRTYKIQ